MLVYVGIFALVFAFWETLWPLYLIAAGPFCGAMIQRARGVEGVTGGVLGGILTYSGFVMFAYVRLFYLGDVGADAFVVILALFLTAALFGALVGLAVGCFVDAVTATMLYFSTRQNKGAEPVANVNLFDRKRPKMTPED
jgi:hypothetical protein